jgi:hypothetical protein
MPLLPASVKYTYALAMDIIAYRKKMAVPLTTYIAWYMCIIIITHIAHATRAILVDHIGVSPSGDPSVSQHPANTATRNTRNAVRSDLPATP